MKKGFTLIELLAVIVILAILALIVSPIITGVISDAKKASAERSTEGYIKAVEYAQVQYQYKNKGSITQSIEKLSISAQGIDKITVTNIEFSTSGIVTSATIFSNGYKCLYLKNKTECKIPSPNEALISILYNGGNSTAGLVADSEEGRYYFRGANPKNKLILQENVSDTIIDVDYRIISFEADGTIKVVREEPIGNKAWDTQSNRPTADHSFCNNSATCGCNAWGNQSNTYRNGALMNDYFSLKNYASNTATNMGINGTETGDTPTTVTKDSSLNEYLNGTYLTTNLEPIKNYIDEHMWDVGGVFPVTKDFKKDIDETKVNQWKGYIALPSVIDYKNASDNTTQCINIYSSVNVISGTSYYPCTKNSDGTVNNYLYKSAYRPWSLSASAGTRGHVWCVGSSGSFGDIYASNARGARLAFYLKSTIKLTGEGIEGNEFKIAKS